MNTKSYMYILSAAQLENTMKAKTVSGTRQLDCFAACVLQKSGIVSYF
jgi:hypothetical protein